MIDGLESLAVSEKSDNEKDLQQSKVDSDMKFAQEAQSAAAEIAEAQNQGISM